MPSYNSYIIRIFNIITKYLEYINTFYINELFGTDANLRYFLNLFMVGANVYCEIVIRYCVDTIYKHELIYYHRGKNVFIIL